MNDRRRFAEWQSAAVGLALVFVCGCGGVSPEARYRIATTAADARPREHLKVVGLRVDGRLIESAEAVDSEATSLSPLGGSSAIILGRIDVPGSKDIHIEIDPEIKETPFAGLIFTAPCVAEIWPDGTVVVDRAGVPATDAQGAAWESRSIAVDGKDSIVMLPAAK